jgi:hypothetical protein
MGVSGQHHAPAALYPRGKDPRYPLYRRLGGPQSRSGHKRLEEKSFAPAGDRTPIARSSSPLVRHYTAWANPAPTKNRNQSLSPVNTIMSSRIPWMICDFFTNCQVLKNNSWTELVENAKLITTVSQTALLQGVANVSSWAGAGWSSDVSGCIYSDMKAFKCTTCAGELM